MPYITIKTTQVIRDETVKRITIKLSEILGKSKETVMLDFQIIENLYIGGEILNDGIIVNVFIFGYRENDIKRRIHDGFIEIIANEIKISKENIYILFNEHNEWGYKGNYLSQ